MAANDLEMYTGKIIYKEIAFTFAFDRNKLRLIPPKDKEYEIEMEWGREPLGNGWYTSGDPIPVDVDFLIGQCNETRHHIIFLPKQGATLTLYNSVVYIPLTAYVICKFDRDSIDRVSFSCPEINHIHPANQALTMNLGDFHMNGVVTVSTPDFEATTTETQEFVVDGKTINTFFAVTRTASTRINEPPLRLDSSLMFEFDATDDYRFIFRLWTIAREFIRFLCYRKNVFIPEVKLSAPCEDGKHEKFATMYVLGQDGETEAGALKKDRVIKQRHISGHEGKILSDIAGEKIYLRHLPETYQSGRHIDAARFVMITAAFEWEFRRLYPNGIEKSPETIEAEEAVSECIQHHIDETSGKKKSIYKFLKRLVKSDSLQKEIVQMGNDFSEIIGVFGKRLYHLNGQELNYSEMGERLAAQRNHFAHGDLEKDFIGLSLLDLIFMEYVIYAMQLRYYGIANIEIQRAINELFHLNFAI